MTNPKKIRITAYIDANVYEVLREVSHYHKQTNSSIVNAGLQVLLKDLVALMKDSKILQEKLGFRKFIS